MSKLSEVMKTLRKSIDGVRQAMLDAVPAAKASKNKACGPYLADTITIVGEVDSAMEVAEQRLLELEDAGVFVKPSRVAPPLAREPVEEEEPFEVEPEDESEPEEPEELEEEPAPTSDLSDDAINAIIQHVDACAAHEAAMEQLRAAAEAAATTKPGSKREAALQLAQAQARAVETWTAQQETYDLQKLLADRVRPV